MNIKNFILAGLILSVCNICGAYDFSYDTPTSRSIDRLTTEIKRAERKASTRRAIETRKARQAEKETRRHNKQIEREMSNRRRSENHNRSMERIQRMYDDMMERKGK